MTAESTDLAALRAKVDECLGAGKPADAVCYLAELVALIPEDRHTRVALAISLGDAGFPTGALKILRATADHLAHQGFLLPAMIVVRHGLEHAPDDASLVSTLRRLHVRGVRAKAGNLPMPPPLNKKDEAPQAATAESLFALEGQQRLDRATEVGTQFPDKGQQKDPIPMPLFSELDEESFVETVRQLHYKRVGDASKLLVEGAAGDTVLIIADGKVAIDKGGTLLATIGAGSVLGEMALITGAPRSASATTEGEAEYFELSRSDVEKLAKDRPKIAEELVEYCRKRLVANLLRSSPLFKRFDEDTRYDMIGRFQRGGFQAGKIIIEQGEPGKGLFVVATGEVEIKVKKEDGEEIIVANLGPGDVFGEISLLKDSATTATVTARGRVGALFLPRGEFRKVLDERPEVKEYLESLSDDRLKASQHAAEDEDVLEADELIIL